MGRAVSRVRSARRRIGKARQVRTKRASSLINIFTSTSLCFLPDKPFPPKNYEVVGAFALCFCLVSSDRKTDIYELLSLCGIPSQKKVVSFVST